jgi:quinoprotein glucose dehydrogenase
MTETDHRIPEPLSTMDSTSLLDITMSRVPQVKYPKVAGLSLVIALGFVTIGVDWRSEKFVPGGESVDWPTTDGRLGTHYSPLSDITPENVRYLEVAWSYHTGDVHTHEDGMAGTAFEATPIMVDGVLYVSTPYGRAIALDAESGEELWTFDPEIDRSDRVHTMTTSRGLSYWSDPLAVVGEECAARVVLASYDARLFSLDAATGAPCADFSGPAGLDLGDGVARIEGRRGHFKHTAPPTVVNGVVVVGSVIYDGHFVDAPSGVVRAFDARTGELLWAWEPLTGVEVTLGTGEEIPTGAANTWATITADPERDLVFVPTGSPSPDHYGGMRPGDNRYANSLVALKASTGEVVWHFQMVHHDLWDYDLPSPPALILLERNGEQIPAVVQGTKTGQLFVFHRETGEPLFPITEMPVPLSDVAGESSSPTQPIPDLPPPLVPQGLDASEAWVLTPVDRGACRRLIESLRSDGVYTPPSFRGSIASPGFVGGMEWGGVAFDPASGLLVTNTNRVPMVVTLIPRKEFDAAGPPEEGANYTVAPQSGTPYAVRREPLLSPFRIPCSPPPWGVLHAVDMSTGQVAWEVPFGRMNDFVKVPTPMRWGSPNMGGPLITGGLIFIAATMDRRLRAFELASGDVVWTTKLSASAQSAPMTYRARAGGRQYVVIAAGGHDGMRSSLGDEIVAYALPAPEGVR